MIDKAYLEITNICNLRCSFCHGTKREKRMLTDEEFELITDHLAGNVKFLYFHLMGEPLLHPSFPHFVKRAWKKGFYPILTTNGSL
ncbi:MAG: radical SAM protein, partial [Clostridia bacterium]|nr:radical SAM protein [Clostridia bacterium]